MILGIIGKVGSGKTVCVEYLEKEYDAKVFSCDNIAKEVIDSNETDYVPLPPLVLFRDEMAQKECREKIHPIVFNRIKKSIEIIENNEKHNNSNLGKLIVVECALPNETFYNICDKVIYIKNSFEDKFKLLKEKRGYSEEIIKQIYNSQKYYDKFYSKANYIIINDGTKQDLERKIKEVIDEIYIICK